MFFGFKKYKCIRQHDITDCGAACLATVFKYYHLTMSVTKIREISGTTRDGTNAYGMVKAAKSMGFITKGVKLPKDDFTESLQLPAIAHVIAEKKRHHYVVVYSIGKQRIIVADPAKGMIRYTREEFFDIWTGGFIFLEPGEGFKKGNDTRPLFLTFFRLLFPFKRNLLKVFFISIAYVVLGIVGSLYVKFLFDSVLTKKMTDYFHVVSSAFLFLTIIQVTLFYIRSNLLASIGIMMDRNLMMEYYRHVLNLPMGSFDNRKVGEIISRFMDASKIREAVSGVTLTLMVDTVMAMVGGVILYYQNERLFIVSFVILFVYGIIVLFFNKPIRKINQEQMENNAKLTSYLVESLEGIETVKAFHAEVFAGNETQNKFDTLIKSVLKGTKLSVLLGSLTSGISMIGTLIILWLGTYFILSGSMTSGEMLAFNALLVYFLSPVRNLIDLQSSIQTAIVASRRLGEILELEIEKETVKVDLPSLFTSIQVNNVVFRYGSQRPVLNNITLWIEPGERIAIVGESGSGKTTLIKLLMRFYLPEEGEIKFSETRIEEIPISHLRKKVSLVSQQPFLFAGSIKENLCFGDDSIMEDEMIDACKIASVHDFIEDMPLQYETQLEENGSNLSGGQRQRLSIARAILRKPDVLIFDEATSNLDSITEKNLENTLGTLEGKITIIIIAHRLSMIRKCDRIFVLEKGTIAEWGTHESLIENRGVYYQLFSAQTIPEL